MQKISLINYSACLVPGACPVLLAVHVCTVHVGGEPRNEATTIIMLFFIMCKVAGMTKILYIYRTLYREEVHKCI